MSAGERLQVGEQWSPRQAGAIIESLLTEYPGMRVVVELPPAPDDYSHLPSLVRASERALKIAESDTSV